MNRAGSAPGGGAVVVACLASEGTTAVMAWSPLPRWCARAGEEWESASESERGHV